MSETFHAQFPVLSSYRYFSIAACKKKPLVSRVHLSGICHNRCSSIFSRGRRALTDCANPCFSPHVREAVFRNPGKFACGFRNPWLWNPEYSSQRIWNPTSDWNPESKFHSERLESITWNPESMAWNPESKTVLDSLLCGDAFLNLLTRLWLCRGYNLSLFILPFQCC